MSKKILIGHRDKGYREMLKSILVENGYSSKRIRLVQSSSELVTACSNHTYDVVIVSDNIALNRRIEIISSNPINRKYTKTILLVNTISLKNYQAELWSNASIIDYTSESVQQILKVVGEPLSQVYLSPSLAPIIAEKFINPRLSESDLEVLWLMCMDCSSGEIAKRLGKSKRTIDSQRLKLKEVIGVRGVAGLALFALENGMFDPEKY